MTLTVLDTRFSQDQKDLIKRTICKDATDDQLSLFEYVCARTGLDPFMKQVYGIVRKSKDGAPTMTIQTSIDGLRLIADRTGNYLPGRESTYVYDKDGRVIAATSYIKKRTKDGQWHEIGATAFVNEYRPKYTNDFWDTKTHIMIAKCAEALALRKSFPAEMSGVYAKEEMAQADEMTDAEFEDLTKEKVEAKRKKLKDIQLIGAEPVKPINSVKQPKSDEIVPVEEPDLSEKEIAEYLLTHWAFELENFKIFMEQLRKQKNWQYRQCIANFQSDHEKTAKTFMQWLEKQNQKQQGQVEE